MLAASGEREDDLILGRLGVRSRRQADHDVRQNLAHGFGLSFWPGCGCAGDEELTRFGAHSLRARDGATLQEGLHGKKAPLAGAITVLGMAFLSPAILGGSAGVLSTRRRAYDKRACATERHRHDWRNGRATPGDVAYAAELNPACPAAWASGSGPSLGSMLKATTKCRRAARGFRVCRTTLNGHLLRSCRTRGKGRHHVQICRMFDEMGRHASTCKKVAKKKPNCHRVKTTRARGTTLIDQGWNGTTIPQLVRIYKGGQGGAPGPCSVVESF